MPDTLAGITHFRIDGTVPGYWRFLENITSPFEDGVALREMGKHSNPTKLKSFVDEVDAAAVLALKTSIYPGICGDPVTLVQRGQSFGPIFLLDFTIISDDPVTRICGGNVNTAYGASGFWVITEWTAIYGGTP